MKRIIRPTSDDDKTLCSVDSIVRHSGESLTNPSAGTKKLRLTLSESKAFLEIACRARELPLNPSFDSVYTTESGVIDTAINERILYLENLREKFKKTLRENLESIVNVKKRHSDTQFLGSIPCVEDRDPDTGLTVHVFDIDPDTGFPVSVDTFLEPVGAFQPKTGHLSVLWPSIIELGFTSDDCNWTFTTLLNLSMTCKDAGIFLLDHWWKPINSAHLKSSPGEKPIFSEKPILKKNIDCSNLRFVKLSLFAYGPFNFCTYCRTLSEDCRNKGKHVGPDGFKRMIIVKKTDCIGKATNFLKKDDRLQLQCVSSSESEKNPIDGCTFEPRNIDVRELVNFVDGEGKGLIEMLYKLKKNFNLADEIPYKLSSCEKFELIPYEVKCVKRHEIRLNLHKVNKIKDIRKRELKLKWPPKRVFEWEEHSTTPKKFGYNMVSTDYSVLTKFNLPGSDPKFSFV